MVAAKVVAASEIKSWGSPRLLPFRRFARLLTDLKTLLDVSKSASTQSATVTNIQQLSQYNLSASEDSCMTLVVSRPPSSKQEAKGKAAPPQLLAGINSSEAQQCEGKNEHFRVFSVAPEDNAISAVMQRQLFTPTMTADVYQRVLRTRGPLAAAASGGGKHGFEVVLVSTGDFSLKRRIPTETEVADLDLAEDGTLVHCTSKDILITSGSGSSTPTKLNFQTTPAIPGTLRTIRFLGRDRIVAIINAPQRSGSELLLLDATTGGIVARRKLHKGIGAATSLDTVALSTASGDGIIAVAGADQSVEVLVVDDGARLETAHVFKDVHPFQISKVVFSPAPAPPAVATDDDETPQQQVIRLATTSIGNTVVVHTLPLIVSGKDGYALLRSGAVLRQTAISVLLSLVAVVVFAALLQLVFVARGGLTGLPGISEMLPPIPGMGEHTTTTTGVVKESDVDAFIAGMRSGAATDPFGEGDVVDGHEIREELLKKVVAASDDIAQSTKDELCSCGGSSVGSLFRLHTSPSLHRPRLDACL